MGGKLPFVALDLMDMESEPADDSKPLRGLFVEVLRMMFFVCCLLIPSRFIVLAALTGRTIFPAKYNRTYVTWTDGSFWFVVSVVAWLLMWGILAYISFRCWQRVMKLLKV